MTITRNQADAVAKAVYGHWHAALQEAKEHRKLDALGYSECRHERWLVFETYWRLWHDSKRVAKLMSFECEEDWDCWMEAPFPSDPSSRTRIDLAFGPVGIKVAKNAYPPPLPETPVFEAKILASIDRRDGINSIQNDINRSIESGLKNAYIFVLQHVYLNDTKLRFKTADEAYDICRNMLCEDLKCVEYIGNAHDFADWGPYSPDLKLAFESAIGRYCFFSQAFRVIS